MSNAPASQEHRELRALVRQIAQTWKGPQACTWNEQRALPANVVDALHEADLMSLCAPEDLGGAGLDEGALFILLEELGGVDGSLALLAWAHQCTVLGALLSCEKSDPRDDALRYCIKKAGFSSALLTTPLPFYAPIAEQGVVLLLGTERACLIKDANILDCKGATLSAAEALSWKRFEGGTGAHVLSEMLELDAQIMRNASCRLTNLGLLAIGIGMLRASVEAGRSYAAERKQFGKAIVELDAVKDLISRAASALENAEALGSAARKASSPYRLCQEALQYVLGGIDACLQIHGGVGYTRELFIERHLRDAKLCQLLATQWSNL